MILLYWSYDFGETEVLFGKTGAIVLDLRQDTSFGPYYPKCSLKAPDPKVQAFFKIS